jgi:multisite-specific tRNA:(cytosine-C5)-methyltransferase
MTDTGSHVVRFVPEEVAGGALPHELLLPIWKSNVSVSLMLDKKAKRYAILLSRGMTVD